MSRCPVAHSVAVFSSFRMMWVVWSPERTTKKWNWSALWCWLQVSNQTKSVLYASKFPILRMFLKGISSKRAPEVGDMTTTWSRGYIFSMASAWAAVGCCGNVTWYTCSVDGERELTQKSQTNCPNYSFRDLVSLVSKPGVFALRINLVRMLTGKNWAY